MEERDEQAGIGVRLAESRPLTTMITVMMVMKLTALRKDRFCSP